MDFKKFMTTDAGWGMFCLRIVTGIIFIGHGLPKFGWVAFFETFGGAFLVIGLLTRFWSAGLAFAMLIAVTLVHLESGMFAQGGYQWALLLMACSLALMFEGAGKGSLDKKLTS